MTVLDEGRWRALQHQHVERVTPWIQPRLERRAQGQTHPVDDFLFDYYNWRPAQLLRWHPGAGVTLTGDVDEWRHVRGYAVVDGRAHADLSAIEPGIAESVLTLLEATEARAPNFTCFGRHEWAMVHGLDSDGVRHASWPLRPASDQIAQVVEGTAMRCTHFDAFRFFTPSARPLNAIQLTRASQIDWEQPGCLHAAMDLYKWAFRCYPLIGADLTADAFAVARDARELDMRAAPYDLRDLGYLPIPIETAEGRAEYVSHQRDITQRSSAIRARLLDELRHATKAPVA